MNPKLLDFTEQTPPPKRVKSNRQGRKRMYISGRSYATRQPKGRVHNWARTFFKNSSPLSCNPDCSSWRTFALDARKEKNYPTLDTLLQRFERGLEVSEKQHILRTTHFGALIPCIPVEMRNMRLSLRAESLSHVCGPRRTSEKLHLKSSFKPLRTKKKKHCRPALVGDATQA